MRKEFSQWAERRGAQQSNLIFLTGDLGFQALENVQEAIKQRFVNMGISEQNMISVAAALAHQGLSPICYSIAPFAVFRPCEQIRLDICLHHLNVKIVGNGGGYGYGIMGATHHALEDLAVLSSFQKMNCYIPYCNEDIPSVCEAMMNQIGPSYLRMGFGVRPENISLPSFAPIRKLTSGPAPLTIIGVGPVLLNAIQAMRSSSVECDIFAVSQFPLFELDRELVQSIQRNRRILVVEEHVRRGGLGEMLSLLLLENSLSPSVVHLYAQGYPNQRYGNQAYHQALSGLDVESIQSSISKLLKE